MAVGLLLPALLSRSAAPVVVVLAALSLSQPDPCTHRGLQEPPAPLGLQGRRGAGCRRSPWGSRRRRPPWAAKGGRGAGAAGPLGLPAPPVSLGLQAPPVPLGLQAPLAPGPPGVSLADFSVNAAAVDAGYADGSIVLRTGAGRTPPGPSTAAARATNRSSACSGFAGLPMADLVSVAYTWQNVAGSGGPFFNPPGGPSVLTPYVNVLVDFDPLGAHDVRVLVLLDDSLNGAITAAIGSYSNPGGLNVLTYSWTSAQDCLVVGSTPGTIPAGRRPCHRRRRLGRAFLSLG